MEKSIRAQIQEAYGEGYNKYKPDEEGWSEGSRDFWGWGQYDYKVIGPGKLVYRPKTLAVAFSKKQYGLDLNSIIKVKLSTKGLELLTRYENLLIEKQKLDKSSTIKSSDLIRKPDDNELYSFFLWEFMALFSPTLGTKSPTLAVNSIIISNQDLIDYVVTASQKG